MPIRVVSVGDDATAFAMAMKWVARRPPFRTSQAGAVGRTILDAVRRGHVRFAVDDGRIVGFGCWALVDEAAARLWREENVQPESDYCQGDTVALLMGVANHPEVAVAAWRHLGALYPGRAYMLRRSHRTRASIGRFRERSSTSQA